MKKVVFFIILLIEHSIAFEGNQKGQQIANKIYEAKVVRTIEGKSLEGENSQDKALSTFITPKDVKGTKFLTWSYKEKADDQWLYLPSLRRVKRIFRKESLK